MTENGGTVKYHRADFRPDRPSLKPWRVWFTKDQPDPYWFSTAEAKAMGLTPPEPAPLVVTCNGHSIKLSDEWAEQFIVAWTGTLRYHGEYDVGNQALARLLRDARQDPQPTVDTPSDDDELPFMSPRQCLEALLAGRDDADELMQSFESWSWPDERTSTGRAMRAIGDAARGGA